MAQGHTRGSSVDFTIFWRQLARLPETLLPDGGAEGGAEGGAGEPEPATKPMAVEADTLLAPMLKAFYTGAGADLADKEARPPPPSSSPVVHLGVLGLR